MSRAEAYVTDVGSRAVTRILSVYELSGGVPVEGRGSLTQVWELGRFTSRVDAAEFLLPRPVVSAELDDGDRNAFWAMARAGRADRGSTAAARALVSELSTQLSELQLDLGFGVEAYLDTARAGYRQLPAVAA